MREIIFRGKSVNDGKWHEGSYISMLKREYIADVQFHDIEEIKIEKAMNEVDPESLGQFTGVIDQHGTKVFEGDIVKVVDHTIEETYEICGSLVTMLMTRVYEVFWNVTKWSIKLRKPMLVADHLIFDLPTSNVTYKVIGNIHDDPGLLE